MRARARLATSLSGAPVEALESEIHNAARTTSQWPDRVPGNAVNRAQILQETITETYTELHRFQNEEGHCVPHDKTQQRVALDHLRSDNVRLNNDSGRLDRARVAARHMNGRTGYSPFVSLAEKLENLVASHDNSEGGVLEIVQNAEQLHTYLVPKAFTVTAKATADILVRGPDENDHAYVSFLQKLPDSESEVLFLGGNLSDYRTSQKSNPYKVQR